MAADYVRMAVTEAKFMTPPHANETATYNREILVVGGGVTGMTAALEAAKAGYKATIVEKASALGGNAMPGVPNEYRSVLGSDQRQIRH